MTSVEVAVIGLGFMGARWARCVAEHPGARLRAVCDVREDVGREAAATWGCEHIGDPQEAAADPDVHGVIVCTPEHDHVEPAMAAIDAGKALAVEKPLAHSFEAARRIGHLAEQKSVPVLVGHILRFEPRYAAVADSLQSGEIGTVQAVRHARVGLVSDQQILQGRTSIALYYGVHEFDLARWYAGELTSVYAQRGTGMLKQRGFDVEDMYSVVMTFSSGAHGTAMLGWSLPSGTPGWGLSGVTVLGENGVLSVDQGALGFTKVRGDRLEHEDVYYSPVVHERMRGAMSIEVDHFIDCVRGDADPLCTAADGAAAVHISTAMEESADRGEVVKLNGREEKE
ncbi:MAG: Gfo/Idh/MocA family protein [Actinomycetota bacterium]